jgi:hypothetical protein
MSSEKKSRIVVTSAVAVLALLAASCGTQSNAPVPTGSPGANEAVLPQRPGAQPTAPGGGVAVPEIADMPNDVNVPVRTPGDQPVDPGPIVIVPSTVAPPILVPPDTDSTPTLGPSEQLPVPEVP